MSDSSGRSESAEGPPPNPPNPNATGSTEPLPGDAPGAPGRETHERYAALRRADQPPASQSGAERVNLAGVAHKLFAMLADNVRDYAVFLTDPDGIIRYWGEGARLMKWWTRQQAEGSHLRLLYLDGGSEDGTAEAHLSTAADRGEYTGEGRRVRNDGSTFWAGITLTALRDEDGGLLGFVKVTRDFSARRAVEAALAGAQDARESQRIAEEANRLKSLFLGSVSHEVRGPLNAMLGYLELLERQVPEHGPQRTLVTKLRNSGRHLMHIVEDVLDITRMEAGQMRVNLAAGRIGPPIEAALSDMEPLAKSKVVRLTNAISGSAAELPYWGDEVRVRQIVTNLLSNAVKFTGAGGEVIVSAGTAEEPEAEVAGQGPWLYVRVEDTGEGIAPDRLAAIFEPFAQARPSDANSGTGLGLSISRRLARLMGGDLTARSQAGVGSQFLLWLPIAASTSRVPR